VADHRRRRIAFDDDVWELYDGTKDWSQADDLAKKDPKKLHELQRLFLIEATKYNVLPLDDRGFERGLAKVAGRPELIQGHVADAARGYGSPDRSPILDIKNRSFSVTADVVIADGGGTGVILNQGGNCGGWALYLKDGRLSYCYNFFGMERIYFRGEQPVATGEHEIKLDFAYDGGGAGKGGTITLSVDGGPGRRRPPRTHPAPRLLRR
jgi:arylsulfatase